jgi:hypothetical protein
MARPARSFGVQEMSPVPAVLPNPHASTPTQHLRPQEVGHEGPGRTRAPWLIARGRSLDTPRLDRVTLHHSSFGSDAAAARFATILVELRIANSCDWKACAGEPAKFLRRTLDRFVRSHGESEIDKAFELSVTLSTDPHEWCEGEDEPDGSQMFLYVEASSCGFVNLGPALALCEKEDPRLPATFARMFLNSIGSRFRIYDDRDAEEHISILEDNYDPQEDAEGLAALPDRNKILPACMKRKSLGRRGLKAMLSKIAFKSQVARLLRATLELSRVAEGVRYPEIPEPVRELFCDCNPPVPVLVGDLSAGRCHRSVFRRRESIDAGNDTGALAADSVQWNGFGKHETGIRVFGKRSRYSCSRAARAGFGSGMGANPWKRGEETMTKVLQRFGRRPDAERQGVSATSVGVQGMRIRAFGACVIRG